MRLGTFTTSLTVAALAMTLATLASLEPARAESLDGPYRGTYVCEKLKVSPDILRAPIDLIVSGTSVRFGRPLFNWDGSRVVGTEMAAGSIDGDGKVSLTSEWFFRGFTTQGAYAGTLTASGGTLTGTQSWHGPDGESGNRACTVAIVAAPHAQRPAAPEHEPH